MRQCTIQQSTTCQVLYNTSERGTVQYMEIQDTLIQQDELNNSAGHFPLESGTKRLRLKMEMSLIKESLKKESLTKESH